MTTTYTEKESSRKKYLVPLVVIMLCLVALTGAAYAYSTSVKGNGDIAGNYVGIDMYVDNGSGVDPRYTATADLTCDVGANSFTVTTSRDNTVNTATSYTATVEKGAFKFSTILSISTNLDATTPFYLYNSTEGVDYTFTEVGGKTKDNLGLGDLTISSVKKADGTDADKDTTQKAYVLYPAQYYTITFTIPVSDGDALATFGTYSNLTDLATDIQAFDTTKGEIKVTFTASSEAPTA